MEITEFNKTFVNDSGIYGIEVYSQDSRFPGFFLTFTGKEIKNLVEYLRERKNAKNIKTA